MEGFTEITPEEIEAFITTHPTLLELREKMKNKDKKNENKSGGSWQGWDHFLGVTERRKELIEERNKRIKVLIKEL